MIDVLVINRDLDLPDVLSTELTAYLPSMTGTGTTPLYPDGNMRVQMEYPISIKTFNGGVRDIEVFLLVLEAMYQRCCGQLIVQQKVQSTRFLKTFEYQMSLLKMMCSLCTLNFNYSTKRITRGVRGITPSLIHRLSIKSPLPASYYMWPNPKWQPFFQSQHSGPPCSDRRRWSSDSGF